MCGSMPVQHCRSLHRLSKSLSRSAAPSRRLAPGASSALPGVDGSDTEAAWTTALAAHLGGEAEQAIDGVVAGRVDVLTDTQAIELDWLKGNKFHEGIGQALHYGDVTGQQPVLALISAYYNIFGAEQQKLEYVSGLCAAHGVEVWALTTRRE